MKYYRYMSMVEFFGFLNEEEISPLRTFENCNTGEKEGMCFLGEETKFDSFGEEKIFRPEDCLHFLNGLVSVDVLVEFETNVPIKETWGRYANPFTSGWDDTVIINEYRVDSYSSKDFKPTRFCLPSGYYDNFSLEVKWEDIEKIKDISKVLENSCIFEDDNIRIFHFQKDYSDDSIEMEHKIPLCHLLHYSNSQDVDIPCVISLNDYNGNVIISTNNKDSDFSIKDELLNKLEDEKGSNFYYIKEDIKEFGTNYGIQFSLDSKGFDEKNCRIYDKETFDIIVEMVSDIMENSKKKEISFGD